MGLVATAVYCVAKSCAYITEHDMWFKRWKKAQVVDEETWWQQLVTDGCRLGETLARYHMNRRCTPTITQEEFTDAFDNTYQLYMLSHFVPKALQYRISQTQMADTFLLAAHNGYSKLVQRAGYLPETTTPVEDNCLILYPDIP
jgi:hypothetical protein